MGVSWLFADPLVIVSGSVLLRVLDLAGNERTHRHDDQQHEDLLHRSSSSRRLIESYRYP